MSRFDERTALDAVSPQIAFDHVRAIADLKRLSGSADEREACRRLQERLASYGLRTVLHEHDAYISLPLAAALQVIAPMTEGHYAITHSFSRPTPAGGLELELLDAGGRLPDDGSARGKAVLLDGLASPDVARRAAAAGVAAAIMVNPGPEIHEMIVSPVWGSPDAQTRAELPPVVVVSVNRATGEALRRQAAGGPLRVRVFAAVDTGWRRTPLLTAEFGEGEDFVLFSGHLDSWYYGAMDNGGANAVMVEVARVLAPQAAALRRRLRLAFWSGHSHGRYSGSTWYVDTFFDELDRGCVAHVNVDSSGARGSVVDLEAMAMAEARRFVAEVYADQGFPGYEGQPMSRSSDQSFWGLGVTALLGGVSAQPADSGQRDLIAEAVTGARPRRQRYAGFGWWWHTPDDTLEHLDPELIARDARLYVGVVGRLCSAERLPFQFADTAAEIERVLADLAEAAGEGCDLRPARAAAAELAAALAGPLPDDATQKALARTLNPVLYTRAGRFGHDPALPLGLLPGLQPARRLAAADPDEARFLRVGLTREQNRLLHALRAARQLVS